jgi:bacterioferritin
MDTQKVVDKLNEILRWEWTGVVQYTQQSFLIQDVWREVYAPMFRGSADESLGHARKIGDKIVALGGIPTVERDQVQQSADLHDMLQQSLRFESEAVRLYREALDLVGDDDPPLRVLLEDVILEEQDGVDHIQKLLGGHKRAAPAKEHRKGKVS